MDGATKDKAQARLKRIAGQIAGIQRMLDDDRHCVDVLVVPAVYVVWQSRELKKLESAT